MVSESPVFKYLIQDETFDHKFKHAVKIIKQHGTIPSEKKSSPKNSNSVKALVTKETFGTNLGNKKSRKNKSERKLKILLANGDDL